MSALFKVSVLYIAAITVQWHTVCCLLDPSEPSVSTTSDINALHQLLNQESTMRAELEKQITSLQTMVLSLQTEMRNIKTNCENGQHDISARVTNNEALQRNLSKRIDHFDSILSTFVQALLMRNCIAKRPSSAVKSKQVDPKFLLILGSICIFINNANGYMEAIPLPKVLDECFKTETNLTSIRDLPGEEIHTTCMYAWEIDYSRSHCCERDIRKTPSLSLNRWKKPSVKTSSNPSWTNSETNGGEPTRYKYTQRGVEHRRYRRSVTPDDILTNLINDYLNHKNTKRRKRAVTKKLRKEYRMLTRAERLDYHKAINMLKDTNHTINYDYISLFHTGDTLGRAHRGPAFPGFHRIYLLYYELLLDYFVPGVALPYWDSSIDKEMAYPAKSIIWTDEFAGSGSGIVDTGPFSNWKTANGDALIRNLGDGDLYISKDNLTMMWQQPRHSAILMLTNIDYSINFEAQHNGPHREVGGHMSSLHTAAMDPMFFMHHCFMDYIWEKFREHLRANTTVDPETDYPYHSILPYIKQLPEDRMPIFESLTNIDGYSDFWTEFYYSYQDHPTCDAEKECGSPYYECLRPSNRCTSVTEAALDTTTTATNVANEMVAMAAGPPPPPNFQTKETQFLTNIKTLSVDNSLNIAAAAVSFSPPSLRLEVERDLRSSCLGSTIQNTFTIDCKSDVDNWAFFPIQIIHLRTDRRKYNEQIIKDNKAQQGFDMFSPKNYAKLENLVGDGNPGKFSSCVRLKAGANKIYIQSNGLSYQGEYRDFAFIDERIPISSTIGYTAIKKPSDGVVEAYIAAMDTCGRLCKPWCLVKGSRPPRYERCTGAIRVSKKKPLMYGNTYGDAILDHWRIDDPNGLPLVSHKGVFMIFYCDYKETWPWLI